MTRAALFDAAARVVGKHGYAGASVARITREAGVAQGTFYNYFTTRQDLLDQLLPALGADMLGFIHERVRGIVDPLSREEAQFRAFFDFLVGYPQFYRILHEAEQFAPKAHAQHFANIEQGYVRSLKRQRGQGDVPDYSDADLQAISYVLMAARDYLGVRYAYRNGRVQPIPEWVVAAYMKLVRHGLYGREAARTRAAVPADGNVSVLPRRRSRR
ncbi:MAG: TetR/AcrR family transcriptional regulator [Alphaproteobacteria bacterium]|nr:TetR/AcrR family transcriptional regulator [Alphaproteobacteria bacterium]